jgi:hypothetical protein
MYRLVHAATLRQVHARTAEMRAEPMQRIEAIKRGELSRSVAQKCREI